MRVRLGRQLLLQHESSFCLPAPSTQVRTRNQTIANVRLVMGEGPTGSRNNATAVAQHCSSVMQFFAKGLRFKGVGQIVASRTEQSLCLKLLANAKLHFAQCSGLCLAADATRLGGRDILLVLVSALGDDGCCRAAWVPPRVHMAFEKVA